MRKLVVVFGLFFLVSALTAEAGARPFASGATSKVAYWNSFEHESDFRWPVWTNGPIGASGIISRYYTANDFSPPGGGEWAIRMQSGTMDESALYYGLYTQTTIPALSGSGREYRVGAHVRNSGDGKLEVFAVDEFGDALGYAEARFPEGDWRYRWIDTEIAAPAGTKGLVVRFAFYAQNGVTDIDILTAETSILYGVHSGLEYGSPLGLDVHIQSVASLNAQISRNGVLWGLIEREQGVRDWSVPDAVIDGLLAREVEPLMVIATSPSWANGSGEMYDVPTSEQEFSAWLGEYRAFVRDAVLRYKDRVKKWELWNEPNLPQFWGPCPNMDLYARWASAIEQEIRAVDPNAEIAFGSLVVLDVDYGDCEIAGRTFLQGLYDRGVFPEIVSVHPYAFMDESPEQYQPNDGLNTFGDVETIKLLMEQNGQFGKQIWITEFGWWVGEGGVSEETQAKYLRLSFEIVRDQMPTVTMAIWFWDNNRIPGGYGMEGWGLIRSDQTIRAAGDEFKKFVWAEEGGISTLLLLRKFQLEKLCEVAPSFLVCATQ